MNGGDRARMTNRIHLSPAPLLFVLAVATACARPTSVPADAPLTWLVVYGMVRTGGGSIDAPAKGVADAHVRSAASDERKCDQHAHLGVGEPEVVRTDATGAFRQVVLATGFPACLHVEARSSDGLLTGSVMIVGVKFRDRRQGPGDSTKVDLVLR